jgi:hypothetical protein
MRNRFRARLSVEQLEPLTPPSDLWSAAAPQLEPALVQPAETAPSRVRVEAWEPGEDELLTAVAAYSKARRRTTAEGEPFWRWKLNTGGRVVTSVLVAPAIDPGSPYVLGLDYKGGWNPDTGVLRLTMFRSGGYLVNVQYQDGGSELYSVGAGVFFSESIPPFLNNPRHRNIQTPRADLILVEKPDAQSGGFAGDTGWLSRSITAFAEDGQGDKIKRATTVGQAADRINAAFLANGSQPISVVLVGYGDQNGTVGVGQGLAGNDPTRRISPLNNDTVGLRNFIQQIGPGKISELTVFASYSGLRWDQPTGLLQQLADGLQTRTWGYTGTLAVTLPTSRNIPSFQTLNNSGLVTALPR